MAHLHALVQARARHIGVLEALSCPSTADLCVGLAAFAEGRLDRLTEGPEPSDAERLVPAVELAARFTTAMRADPLLSPELLPEPWPAPGGPRR